MRAAVSVEPAGDDGTIGPGNEGWGVSDDVVRRVLKTFAALPRSDDPERVLDLLVSTVLLVIPVAGVWAGLQTPDGRTRHAVVLDPSAGSGRGSMVRPDRLEMVLETWCSRLAPGQPPFQVDVDYEPLSAGPDDQAMLTVFPMSSPGGVGALVLGAPLSQLNGPLAIVALLCDRTATALELASARVASRRAEALSAALTELAASHSDPDLVFDVIVRRARSLFQADAAYVMLVDECGETLRVRTAHGVTDGAFYDATYPVDGELTAVAIAERRVVCGHEGRPPDESIQPMTRGLRATMCAPMFAEDRLVGVLLAAHRDVREFSPDDRQTMAALGDAAALAIANSRAHAGHEGAIRELAEANVLLAERSSAAERALEFQQRLTALILKLHGLEEIVHVTGQTLGCHVLLLDREFGCLYASRGASLEGSRLREVISSIDVSAKIEQVQLENQQVAIAPVNVESASTAYLVAIWEGAPEHGVDVSMMIEAAVTAIGLELMRDREALEAEARLTGDLFAKLLTDEDADELTIQRRASHFGYELGGMNGAIALVGDDAVVATRRPSLETSVQRSIRRWRGGRTASFRHGDAMFVLVAGGAGDMSTDLLEDCVATIKQEVAFSDWANKVRIAYAGPHAGVAGARRAVREAHYALNILEVVGRHGTPRAFDDLGVWTLLGGIGDAQQLVAFAESVLGPLIAHDAERQSQLVDTVRGLAESNFHYRTAAEVLFTHPNTLRYRMARINELTGLDFTNAEDRLKAEISMRILDVVGRPRRSSDL